MTIIPCENCPEAAWFRSNSNLKSAAEAELEDARAKQTQLRAGRSALRNIWSEFAPTRSEWEAARKIELAKTRIRRYSRLLPEDLKEAINECHAPFVQTYEVDDSTNDKWQTRLCGARVALSNVPVSGFRVETGDDALNSDGPEETEE